MSKICKKMSWNKSCSALSVQVLLKAWQVLSPPHSRVPRWLSTAKSCIGTLVKSLNDGEIINIVRWYECWSGRTRLGLIYWKDQQLLVRSRNFLHISLQINVWISQNSDQDFFSLVLNTVSHRTEFDNLNKFQWWLPLKQINLMHLICIGIGYRTDW